jgi:hypothetical protein
VFHAQLVSFFAQDDLKELSIPLGERVRLWAAIIKYEFACLLHLTMMASGTEP